MLKIGKTLLSAVCLCSALSSLWAEEGANIPTLELTEVKKVFSGKHNAFTGMVKFKDNYYLAFRHGTTHMAMDGQIYVLKSPDGINWEQCYTAGGEANSDYRDAKIVVANGKMYMYCCIFENDVKNLRTYKENVVFISEDGVNWERQKVNGTGFREWLWFVVHKDNGFYGTTYSTNYGEGEQIPFISRLYVSVDGINWMQVAKFDLPWGNESPFDIGKDGRMDVFVRNENNAAGSWYRPVIYSFKNYKELNKMMEPRQLPLAIHGPYIKRFDGGALVIGRTFKDEYKDIKLEAFWVGDDGSFAKLLTIAEGHGDDCAYACWVDSDQEGEGLISYYSGSHDGSSIYVGKIKLNLPPQNK